MSKAGTGEYGHKLGRKLLRCALQAAGITLLAYLLSLCLLQPFSFSASSLLSPSDRSDFQVTDFYHFVADNRAVSQLDTSIVLVNIDRFDRSEITDLLELISECEPKAVGLDVLFELPKEDDARLVDAIRSCPNVVMATAVDGIDDAGHTFRVSTRSCIDSLLTDIPHGVINLPNKHSKSNVRKFRPVFDMEDGTRMEGFATAVATLAKPGSEKELFDRGEELVTINYPSRVFRVIEPEEILDNIDQVRGKIVMIGGLTDPGDCHLVPTGKTISGIEIHAHSVATIINGNYLDSLSKFNNKLIAILICYVIAFLWSYLNPGYKGVLMRVIQIALLYLLIRFGYMMFVEHGIMLDLSMPILMVAFAFFACDIWISCQTTLNWILERRQRRRIDSMNKEDITQIK